MERFDGDIVATTDNPYFLKGVRREFVPITYEKKTAEKAKVEKENLFMADKNAFHSTIGTITNYSTSMYAMLPLFDKESDEYIELDRRLKILRKEQGSAIDHAKGILTNPFPKEWINYVKITDEDRLPENQHIKELKDFRNRIVSDKKPYFMYHLYNNSKKLYNKFRNETNTFSRINFDLTIDELLSKENKNEEELKYCNYYNKRNPLNESNCVMNILCRYVERVNEEKFKGVNKGNEEYLLGLMINKDLKLKNKTMKKIEELYQAFTRDKRTSIIDSTNLNEDGEPTKYKNISDYYYNEALKICSNDEELANYAIELDYNKYKKVNKDFTWKVCKNGVLKNIKINNGNKVTVPILDVEGDIEYLGYKYSKKEFEIND